MLVPPLSTGFGTCTAGLTLNTSHLFPALLCWILGGKLLYTSFRGTTQHKVHRYPTRVPPQRPLHHTHYHHNHCTHNYHLHHYDNHHTSTTATTTTTTRLQLLHFWLGTRSTALGLGGGAALNDNRITFPSAAPHEGGQRLILGGCWIDNPGVSYLF